MDVRGPAWLALGVFVGWSVSRRVLLDRSRADFALTDRQIEILWLVARGLTTKEIARREGISPHSVSTHIRRACRTLGVPTRAAAAAIVWRGTDQLVVPARPSRSATSLIAAITSVVSSSNGIAMSSAPLSIISRLTARAKALSFIFFFTEVTSTS